MKLFVHLAVILAFASPAFANTGAGSATQPTHKAVADKDAKKKKKKKKGDKEAAAPADAAPAPTGDAGGHSH